MFFQRFSVENPNGVKRQSAVLYGNGLRRETVGFAVREVGVAARVVTIAAELISFAFGNRIVERYDVAFEVFVVIYGSVGTAVGVIDYRKLFVSLEYRVQENFVVVDFGKRFVNRQFVFVNDGLSGRNG